MLDHQLSAVANNSPLERTTRWLDSWEHTTGTCRWVVRYDQERFHSYERAHAQFRYVMKFTDSGCSLRTNMLDRKATSGLSCVGEC